MYRIGALGNLSYQLLPRQLLVVRYLLPDPFKITASESASRKPLIESLVIHRARRRRRPIVSVFEVREGAGPPHRKITRIQIPAVMLCLLLGLGRLFLFRTPV